MFQDTSASARAEKRTLGIWLAVHVIAALVGIGLVAGLGPNPNNVLCTGADQVRIGYKGCLSWSKLFCVIFIVVTLFVYLWSGESVVFSSTRLSQWTKQHKLTMAGVASSFLLTVVLCILSWTQLMKPADTYQTYSDGSLKPRPGEWTIDALQVFFGGLLFAALMPFAVALLLVMRNSGKPRPQSTSEIRLNSLDNSVQRCEEVDLNTNVSTKMLLVALTFLFLSFVMSGILGPLWNFTLTYYITLVSPYSLVFWPIGGELPYCKDPAALCGCVFPTPDMDPAFEPACWFSFKIYTDTLIFYVTITTALLIGYLARRKGWCHKVLGSSWSPPQFRSYFLGLSRLEASVWLVMLWLFLSWFIYWTTIYGRYRDLDTPHDCAYDWDGGFLMNISQQDTTGPCPPDTMGWSHASVSMLHVLARSSGHMASLSFSLTLLPAGKHSPLLRALGISWERALHWHRGLGYVSFLAVLSHFFLWGLKWAHDGTFWKNTFVVDTQSWLWVSPVWHHYENWSVRMMMLGFIVFTVSVSLAYTIRRTNYRLFYLAHSFMLVFVGMALIHAWSFWYFAVPGLTLWWCDRLWRMVLASIPVGVTRIEFAMEAAKPDAELVLVELSAPHLTKNFRPGQYAFLHIPSVSRTEWHPFTMNVWGDSAVFIIKGMNSHGWTQRLKSQVREGGETAASLSLGVLAMGPYGGLPRELLRSDKVLLVAGGIGITPILAAYQACLKSDSVRRLTLVWVFREAPLLTLPLIADALNQSRSGVEVFVYVTDPTYEPETSTTSAEGRLKAKRGRPDLGQIFTDFAGKEGKDSWSFACGPLPLQQEVEVLSEQFGFHSHVETFLF